MPPVTFGNQPSERLCPSLAQGRVWTSAGWEVRNSVVAAYDEADRTLHAATSIDGGDGLWEKYRDTYTYGTNGLRTGLLHEEVRYIGGPVYQFEDRYSYNEGGRLESREQYARANAGAEWFPEVRETLSYGTHPLATEHRIETWSGGQWEPTHRYTFQYTEGSVTIRLQETWTGTAWISSTHEAFSYTNTGLLTSYVYSQGEPLTVLYRNQYSYDLSNRLAVDRFEAWDGAEWIEPREYSYSYSEGGLPTEVIVSYSLSPGSTPPEPVAKERFTFDRNQDLIERTEEYRDSATDSWTPSRRYLSAYQDGHLLVWTSQSYMNEAWVNELSSVYTYDSVVSTTLSPEALTRLTVSPNPVHTVGNVQYQVSTAGRIRLSVVDILGRTVFDIEDGVSAVGTHRVAFDASSFAPGLYILRMESSTGTSTRTITVAR